MRGIYTFSFKILQLNIKRNNCRHILNPLCLTDVGLENKSSNRIVIVITTIVKTVEYKMAFRYRNLENCLLAFMCSGVLFYYWIMFNCKNVVYTIFQDTLQRILKIRNTKWYLWTVVFLQKNQLIIVSAERNPCNRCVGHWLIEWSR